MHRHSQEEAFLVALSVHVQPLSYLNLSIL